MERRGTPAAYTPSSKGLDRDAPLEGAMNELYARIDSRLASVWKELTTHAESAATRADSLESKFSARIEKIESNFMTLLRKNTDDTEYVKEKDLIKHLEWLNWRMSWLEWATNGEKRSF